eukprot:3464225-Amphidinium_carterae.1
MQTRHNRSETEYVSIHEVVRFLLDNESCGAEILRHRATSTGSRFVEEVVMWMHVIGRIILPCLKERRATWDVPDLESLFRLLYDKMGTECMKDLSHLGAMAQYGDEANAEQMGVEPIHTSDYGNRLYAEVLTEGHLH